MKMEKLSPGLLVCLEDYVNEGEAGLFRNVSMLGVNPNVGRPTPAKMVVFVHCAERADLRYLSEAGIEINQQTGRIRTGYLPIEGLETLSELPEVKRIVSSRIMRPLMDRAARKAQIPKFRTTTGLTGAGALIGIIDTGIDTLHRAFKNRILRIWDQEMRGLGVAEGKYGTELKGLQLALSRDTDGHGTHVAGIAAGSDSTFGGVAPGAELIIVKTDFQDAHIADAVRYIFRIARELGRPAVVNLSLGDHYDAHDGSDSLSRIIDTVSGPGRIVCCAAGNEGLDNIHAQVILKPGASRTLRFNVPHAKIEECTLNGWYPGAGSFEISIRSPSGESTASQGVIVVGKPVNTFKLKDGRVRITTTGADPSNNDHHFLVQINGVTANSAVVGGGWHIVVKNVSAAEGHLDIWTLDDQDFPEVVFNKASAQNSMKIGSPGCSASAVTVASFTTKNEWVDIAGQQESSDLTLNDISDFSSDGPLRNGALKPDVAAPGAMIVSALSAKSKNSKEDMIDATHLIKLGTSMASPFIAGVAALLLERDPKMDPGTFKNLARANSKIPKQPAGTFDSKWGFGLIEATGL